jgi:predicted naringenin-chalcone synthase
MFYRDLATALPPRAWTQSECWQRLRNSSALSQLKQRSRDLLEKVLLGTNGIDERHFATERLESLFERDARALNESFEREATVLASAALRKALAQADVGAVDALFICTCTGFLCPGLSSHVAEALDLPTDIYLMDVTGAGCGAALPTLRAACSYLKAHPTHRAAVVAVEICSSAFYVSDDPGVLISLCLFGDGAAALVLDGEDVRRGELHFTNFDTLHLPEHREKIRFVNREGKLCNQLHRSVPQVAAQAVSSLHQSNKHHVISHAGGRDVLAAIHEQLPQHALAEAHEVLRHCGNMSSPSVLFALERAMLAGTSSPFWLTSFGAGFACHSCTLE